MDGGEIRKLVSNWIIRPWATIIFKNNCCKYKVENLQSSTTNNKMLSSFTFQVDFYSIPNMCIHKELYIGLGSSVLMHLC